MVITKNIAPINCVEALQSNNGESKKFNFSIKTDAPKDVNPESVSK